MIISLAAGPQPIPEWNMSLLRKNLRVSISNTFVRLFAAVVRRKTYPVQVTGQGTS